MSKIRITILSAIFVLTVAVAVYFAAVPSPAMAAQAGASCPVARPSASSLTVQELWKILNGRYERRVGLPY